MIEFNMKNNIAEVDEYFKRLGYYFPELTKKVLQEITGQMKKELKKNNTFKKRTGAFLNSIYSKIVLKKGWAKVSIRYKKGREDAKNIIKANVAESGANIVPKHSDTGMMRFKINDSWIRTNKITIQPKPFFQRSYENILNNVSGIMDKISKALMMKVNK